MSISPYLSYNRKRDKIDVFKDYEHPIQTPKLADRANVFMLRGIIRQWKQPLAFSFSSGPTSSVILKVMIKEILIECNDIGFDVVATICDQGSNNQAAINTLIKESRQESVRLGQEYKKLGSMIGDREIVPLYDVPHLIKGIRNNFLIKDIHFLDKEKI